jgi:hypothetical protein
MPAGPHIPRPPKKILTAESSLPPRPDLLALVARYGGFSKVPVEAWAAFDRRLAKYRARAARGRSPMLEESAIVTKIEERGKDD